MSHDEDPALFGRKMLDAFAHMGLCFGSDAQVFDGVFRKFQRVHYTAAVLKGDVRVPTHLAVVVDGQIVSYPANPGKEFPLVVVLAAPDDFEGFDEGLLQEVFGHVTVLYNVVNNRKNPVFVPLKEGFKSRFPSVRELGNQLAVAFLRINHGYLTCLSVT